MKTLSIRNRITSMVICLAMLISLVASTGLVSFAIDVAPEGENYEHKDYLMLHIKKRYLLMQKR